MGIAIVIDDILARKVQITEVILIPEFAKTPSSRLASELQEEGLNLVQGTQKKTPKPTKQIVIISSVSQIVLKAKCFAISVQNKQTKLCAVSLLRLIPKSRQMRLGWLMMPLARTKLQIYHQKLLSSTRQPSTQRNPMCRISLRIQAASHIKMRK